MRQTAIASEIASAVAACTGGAEVVSSEPVQELWSGYGQIVRCRLRGGDRERVVVKRVRWPGSEAHPRGWGSPIGHLRKVRSYQVEIAWYARWAERCGQSCRVPSCLASSRLDDGVLLVLEDLDDAGLSARRTSVADVELRACLSWLAHFHATFLGVAPDGLWPVGTYWHLDTRPDELEALRDDELRAAAPRLDAMLSGASFQTLVHGDAKLANFCFSGDGSRVAAVDFQYVGGGCGMKDVAYFIGSCLDENEAERREAELLDLYFGRLHAALAGRPEIDVARLEDEWRSLYPVAWTDFYRFLQGWSPGHWKIHRYSRRLAKEVLASL